VDYKSHPIQWADSVVDVRWAQLDLILENNQLEKPHNQVSGPLKAIKSAPRRVQLFDETAIGNAPEPATKNQNQEIKKSRNQEIKKSRNQEIKKSRNQEIKNLSIGRHQPISCSRKKPVAHPGVRIWKRQQNKKASAVGGAATEEVHPMEFQ
jgi:hypothetical protein